MTAAFPTMGYTYIRKNRQRTGCQNATEQILQLHKTTYFLIVLYTVRQVSRFFLSQWPQSLSERRPQIGLQISAS
jgi:hypothetical protein